MAQWFNPLESIMMSEYAFPELIHEIGRGKTGAKHLTWEQASFAARYLLEGKASPHQEGSFLLAMRTKGESPIELAAFTQAAREFMKPIVCARADAVLDIPSYAGKKQTLHGLIASSIIVASCGTPVLLHGDRHVPGRVGLAPVLSALGIPTDQSPEEAAQQLDRIHVAYVELERHHPRLFHFLELRKQLGVRSLFHEVTRLANPGQGRAQLIGISHPPYLEVDAEALRLLGTARALIFRGLEGDAECPLASEFKAIEVAHGEVKPLVIRPLELNLRLPDRAVVKGGEPGWEAREIQAMLTSPDDPRRDWLVLNAALGLYVASQAPSLAEAVKLATEALLSGRAAEQLARVCAAKKSNPPVIVHSP
jgi:anthranilate phosphoribosyltransferase